MMDQYRGNYRVFLMPKWATLSDLRGEAIRYPPVVKGVVRPGIHTLAQTIGKVHANAISCSADIMHDCIGCYAYTMVYSEFRNIESLHLTLK